MADVKREQGGAQSGSGKHSDASQVAEDNQPAAQQAANDTQVGTQQTASNQPTTQQAVSDKRATSAALDELFSDMEYLNMCAGKSRGWERRALDARVRTGEVTRPVPGLYARTEYWESLDRTAKLRHVIRATAVSHRTWVISHAAAAVLHGADVPYELFWPIDFTTPYEGGGKATRNFRHHRSAHIESVDIEGVRATSAPQTVLDCACAYPFGPALAIADSFLHKGLVTKGELEAELASHVGRRGFRQAKRVVSLADPRPANGGESQVRAKMIELGLPMPEPQAPVADPECPGHTYYVDFLFTLEDGTRMAFELDGLEKYENPAMTGGRAATLVMRDERQREAAITAHGIRVARMGFAQAMDTDFLLKRLAIYGVVPKRGRSVH